MKLEVGMPRSEVLNIALAYTTYHPSCALVMLVT